MVAGYGLADEPHALRLLTLALEASDRCEQARRAIAEYGLTFSDGNGNPRARPEVQIERDSRLAAARLFRELALPLDDPDEAARRGRAAEVPRRRSRRRRVSARKLTVPERWELEIGPRDGRRRAFSSDADRRAAFRECREQVAPGTWAHEHYDGHHRHPWCDRHECLAA
ncbi:MAG TPA: hypothetical protein VFT50_00720 [Baekduia sp.]|nr:hypothetical protein [Baekduia sp.]